MNYYKILGISIEATTAEIKSAYRKLIKQHHPDLIKDQYDINKISMIQEAYQTLSDPTARAIYNQKNFFNKQPELFSVFKDDLKNFETGANDRNLDPQNYQPDQSFNFESTTNQSFAHPDQKTIYQDDGVGGTIFSTQNPYQWLKEPKQAFIKNQKYKSEFTIPEQEKLISQFEPSYQLTWNQVLQLMENSFLSRKQLFYRLYTNKSYFDGEKVNPLELQAELFYKSVLQQHPEYQLFANAMDQQQQKLDIKAKLIINHKIAQKPIREFFEYYVYYPCELCSETKKLSNLIYCHDCNNLHYLKIKMGIYLDIPDPLAVKTALIYPNFGCRSEFLTGKLIIDLIISNQVDLKETEFVMEYGDETILIEELKEWEIRF